MRILWRTALLALLFTHEASAWGQEGHSIIGEIARRENATVDATSIDRLLHHGSLAPSQAGQMM